MDSDFVTVEIAGKNGVQTTNLTYNSQQIYICYKCSLMKVGNLSINRHRLVPVVGISLLWKSELHP